MSKNIKALPIEGSQLREVLLQGNGKDSVLTLVPVDGRPMRFPTDGPDVTLELSGEVTAHVGGVGDTELRLRFTASTLTAVHARVDYPGDDTEWAEQIDNCDNPNTWEWGVEGWGLCHVRLKLLGTT